MPAQPGSKGTLEPHGCRCPRTWRWPWTQTSHPAVNRRKTLPKELLGRPYETSPSKVAWVTTIRATVRGIGSTIRGRQRRTGPLGRPPSGRTGGKGERLSVRKKRPARSCVQYDETYGELVFFGQLRKRIEFTELLEFLGVQDGEPVEAEELLRIRCASNQRFWRREHGRLVRWTGCKDGPSNDYEWSYFREGVNVWGSRVADIVPLERSRKYLVYPDRSSEGGWLTDGKALKDARLFVAADAYVRALEEPDWIIAMTHECEEIGALLVTGLAGETL